MLGLADKARVIELFDAVMRGDIAAPSPTCSNNTTRGRSRAGAGGGREIRSPGDAPRSRRTPPFSTAPPDEAKAAKEYAPQLAMTVLNRAWQILMKGVAEAREAARPLAAADMVLVRLAYAADLPTPMTPCASSASVRPKRRRSRADPGRSAPTMPSAPRASYGGDGGGRGGRAGADAIVGATVDAGGPGQRAARDIRAPSRDVVARAAAGATMQLKIMLERDVRLVRFEQGQAGILARARRLVASAASADATPAEWTGDAGSSPCRAARGFAEHRRVRARRGKNGNASAASQPIRCARRSRQISRRGDRFGEECATEAVDAIAGASRDGQRRRRHLCGRRRTGRRRLRFRRTL